MWLIKASLRNPYMVATIVFMVLVLGVLSLLSIPVDILPVFKSPAVQTLTYYQGMPASSIEKTITNRIERWVNQAPGVEKIESKSVPGVSVVKSYFRGDVNPNAALTVTNSLALGTLATLPPNTLPPVVLPFDPTGTLPLGVLTVSNPSLDEAHVKDLARIDVRNMLGAVPGCVAPVVIGGKDRTVLIYLDPPKLQAHGLSPIDVVQALQKGNVMVTPGTAYFGNNQVLLDTNVMVNKVKELNDLPIVMQPGHQVYLRDIGHAEDSYAIQTSRVRIDGRRQVYVPIYRQQGASSLSVANGVKDHVKYMEERLPAGTKLDFVMDQTVSVREAIRSLIHEGIIGAVLVSLMILIFLGNWRMTVIASLSIPLAVLASIIGLYATGNTINLMVLGGLALAIGPLVDDAIVALENIHRNYDLCKSRMRAAWIGSIEVMVPVLVATCTTSIVLAPLALMPGMGGFLFRPLALAVTFAMFSSFFLSRTFVPMMCAKFLPEEHAHADGASEAHGVEHGCMDTAHHPGGSSSHVRHRIEWFLTGMTRRYERVLAWALTHRALVLTVVALLFVGSLYLATGIGREFFPQVDAGQLTIYVRAPSNLRLDATERRIMAVEQFLEKTIPPAEREMIVSEIGLDPDWSAAYTPNSGQQDGVVRVQFSDRRKMSAQEYAIKLRRLLREDSSFSDLRVAFDTGGMVSTALNYGVSSPIDIQIEGGTLDEGRRLAREVRRQVRRVQGAADSRVMQRLDAPYLIIDVDRKKAAEAGLSAVDVIDQVVAAMNSSISISHNFWIDVSTGNQYFVGVQYPENPNMQLADMLNVPATGANQAHTVYLRNLVNIRHSNDAVEINHVSLYRVFDVMVNTEGRDIAGVAGDVQGRLRDIQKNAWLAEADRLQADASNTTLPKEKQEEAAEQAKEIKEHLPNLLRVDQGVWSFPHRQRVKLMGEFERMNTSFHDLVVGLALAAVLVYLLQVALFRSWVGPFIIMFTVPLGLIGVLTMLFVTHTTLNVQSEMGVIFLVGIAVNNGVLLVEFANKQRRLGASVHRAVATAAAIRFRPIMMTFLATFLDLIPMAIGMGRGSEATIPLARAVVGGLLTSTCLTLLVVPIMYTLMIRDRPETDLDIEAELAEEPVRAIAGPDAAGTGNGDTVVIATGSALAAPRPES